MSVTVCLLVSLIDKINHNIHFMHRMYNTENNNKLASL